MLKARESAGVAFEWAGGLSFPLLQLEPRAVGHLSGAAVS
jgi:hypothetical protein